VSVGPPPLGCAHSPNRSECCSTDVVCLKRAGERLSWWEPGSPTTPRVEGSGRTVLACPTPSSKHPANQAGTRAEPARQLIQSGRLRWLHRLPLVVSWHATVSTFPLVQGQGRPLGQTTDKGHTMTEAAVSFAGNLTDEPEISR
jgi:hypothetical protein